MPCCNNLNEKLLCQPDTGIARVIVDIVNSNDSNVSMWCNDGVNLNSVLPLDEECPSHGKPVYCRVNDNSTAINGLIESSTHSPKSVATEFASLTPASTAIAPGMLILFS